MTLTTRHKSLIFLTGALFALILLSSSLSTLKLLPGDPFPGASNTEDNTFLRPVMPKLTAYTFPFLEGLLALLLSGLLVYIFIRLIKFTNLKYILRLVLILAILILVMILLPRTPINQVTPEHGAYTEIVTPSPETYVVTPLGTPPPVFIWLTSFILILGLSVPLIRMMSQRRRSVEPDDPILREAKIAVAALLDDQNFADVILRCYFEMANAIQQKQGFSRDTSLTVREFKQQLDEHGFPLQPTQNLTTLFEKVRYGSVTIRKKDEELALTSLNAIIQYCQERNL